MVSRKTSKMQRDQFRFVDGDGRAALPAVVDLAGADPLGISPAPLVHGIAAVVGPCAVGAEQLARQQIGVVADALTVLDVLAAPAQHGVGPLPHLLGNDGRDDLARFVLEHHPFLRREELLLLGEHVHHLDLVADIVALVLGVGDHARHGGVGDLLAIVVAVALFPEEVFQLLHGILVGGVQLEQFPHHHCLFLVDDQPPVALCIAENAAVAQHHALFDGLLMAEFHAGGELAQLVLGYGGHDGQAQFRILVQRIDVVVLEKDAHARGEELAGVLDGVQRVAGEAGDLLGDDKVELPRLRIVHHAVEVFAAPGGNAGQALVDVARHERPGGIFADEVFIIADLVAQRVELFVRFRGDAGVIGDAQRNVIDALCPQLLPDRMYVHGGPFHKVRIIIFTYSISRFNDLFKRSKSGRRLRIAIAARQLIAFWPQCGFGWSGAWHCAVPP